MEALMKKNKNLFLSTIASNLNFLTKIIILVLVFGLLLNHINIVILVKAFEKPIETIIQDHSITEINNFERVEIEKEKLNILKHINMIMFYMKLKFIIKPSII